MKRNRIAILLAGLGLSLGGGLVYLDSHVDESSMPGQMVGALGPQIQSEDAVTPGSTWPEEWVSINGGPFDPTQIEVIGKEPAELDLSFKLSGFYLESVMVSSTKCARVDIPKLVKVMEEGLPEVPTLTINLNVPYGGRSRYKIVEQITREIKINPVEPSLGHISRNINPLTVEPRFDNFYKDGGIWPKLPVEMTGPFVLREQQGVNIRVNPLQFDSNKGVLVVTEYLRVTVVTEGGFEKPNPQSTSASGFGQVYQRFYNNYQAPPQSDKYQQLQTAGRMLIVSDDALVDHLSDFAQWKRQRGIDVTIATVSELGGSASAIGRYITDMYEEPAGLTWVILAGDKAQVPTQVGLYDGSDSDSRYAMVAGNDIYPDLFVSRISATNPTNLQTQLNRFIAYEKNPSTGSDAQWYGRAAGIASDEGSPADYRRADLLRDDLLDFGYNKVDQIYQNLGGTTASIETAVENGCSVVNYLGHGSGYGWTSVPFYANDVRDLGNTQAWPWIIDVSCTNGDFALNECFAEAWLRAGTPEQPAGAVAMIASSSDAPWVPPTLMQAEAIDLMVEDKANTIGGLYYSGLMRVLDSYAGQDVAMQVMEQNIVFGDCSLMVRSREPDAFIISTLPPIDDQAANWTLLVNGPEGSVVALTSPGVLHGSGLVDATGQALVQIQNSVTGLDELTVTVTGYNMVPFEGIISLDNTGVVILPDPDVEPEPEPDSVLPTTVQLVGNYPNPFNPSTRIVFELPRDMRVKLSVYDVRGSLVRLLVDESTPAGRQEVFWDGRDGGGRTAASGIYLYQLITPEGNHSGRMILTK